MRIESLQLEGYTLHADQRVRSFLNGQKGRIKGFEVYPDRDRKPGEPATVYTVMVALDSGGQASDDPRNWRPITWQAEPPAPDPWPCWEYTTREYDPKLGMCLEFEQNAWHSCGLPNMGAQGWELVQVLFNPADDEFHAIFKRPR